MIFLSVYPSSFPFFAKARARCIDYVFFLPLFAHNNNRNMDTKFLLLLLLLLLLLFLLLVNIQ